ncbi:uncharacterized protein V1516DRAFT_671068 [Lipomyces oligophaga]|uniref:uncharacterized protein n=1 Tax=Lipomyces oligophaga TaxID=45792 RepID=UPI0034CEC689
MTESHTLYLDLLPSTLSSTIYYSPYDWPMTPNTTDDYTQLPYFAGIEGSAGSDPTVCLAQEPNDPVYLQPGQANVPVLQPIPGPSEFSDTLDLPTSPSSTVPTSPVTIVKPSAPVISDVDEWGMRSELSNLPTSLSHSRVPIPFADILSNVKHPSRLVVRMPYSQLIALALIHAPADRNQTLFVQEIYQYVEYNASQRLHAHPSWRSCIRHELATSHSFQRVVMAPSTTVKYSNKSSYAYTFSPDSKRLQVLLRCKSNSSSNRTKSKNIPNVCYDCLAIRQMTPEMIASTILLRH